MGQRVPSPRVRHGHADRACQTRLFSVSQFITRDTFSAEGMPKNALKHSFPLFLSFASVERALNGVFCASEEDLKDFEGFPSSLRVDLVGWIASSTIKQEEQSLIQLGQELKGKGKGEMPHLMSPLLFLQAQALLLLLLVLRLLLVELMLH